MFTKVQKISVLTPSFNQAEWLSVNLRTVEEQSYNCVEHIVFDGASTDGSVELLASCAAAGRRMQFWTEPDSGQSEALNKAFDKASGDIIGWVNSDDGYFQSDVLEKVVEFFKNHSDVDVVYGHVMLVNESGAPLQLLWVPPYSKWLHRRFGYLHQPGVFLRRRVLGSFLVDPTFDFAMDGALWHRLEEGGCRFARLNDILAIDRHQASRKSENIDQNALDEFERIETQYKLPRGEIVRRLQPAFRVACRVLGIVALIKARRRRTFFEPTVTQSRALKLQLATRRQNMPLR